MKDYNIIDLTFPMSLNEIVKFEKMNNISINVIAYEEGKLFPCYNSKIEANEKINLLLITDASSEKFHYCLITDLSKLFSHRSKHDGKSFICHYCFHPYYTQEKFDEHISNCKQYDGQATSFPQEDYLRFKNFYHQLQVPFVIYADFECFTRKIQGPQNKPNSTNTHKYQLHEPCSFGYKVVCCIDDKYTKDVKIYRGENVIQKFMDCIEVENREIHNILRDVNAPMKISDQEEQSFKNAQDCHICLGKLGSDRVHDHCHLTGKYRGPAHNHCNLNFKFKKMYGGGFLVPVIIHNLRGYDSHLILSQIKLKSQDRISCIANNLEKYISFTIGNLRFIDLLQFLNTSLAQLVDNLYDKGNGVSKFKHSHAKFGDKKTPLLRKGVYPYDYVDSPDKFDETALGWVGGIPTAQM